MASGSGNLAIPAAQAGAVVSGVDISPNLLAQARKRAKKAGMYILPVGAPNCVLVAEHKKNCVNCVVGPRCD